jgi:hypothetical protein
MDRRGFFRALGRAAGFVGLGGLAGVFLLRRQVTADDHQCINRGVCRGCSRAERCILPQAASARQARKER